MVKVFLVILLCAGSFVGGIFFHDALTFVPQTRIIMLIGEKNHFMLKSLRLQRELNECTGKEVTK